MKSIIVNDIITQYSATQDGRIYSHISLKFLKPVWNKGYYRVSLIIEGKKINIFIHRLVATTFIENVDNLPHINHIDNDISNNAVNNLQWVDAQINSDHKVLQNRQAKGEKVGTSKLKDFEVLKIKELYAQGNYSHRQLGKIFKVDDKVIYNIVNNKSWKHI
jgi:hypothetical protein